jgi:DNA mismatch endonuclease (patch repair protein)
LDKVSPEERSRVMARVKSRDTGPEKRVRSMMHRLGLRFRLHRRDLPGTPDLTLPGRQTVVFVHGCFWHRHAGCPQASTPAVNVDYWTRKFARNQARDAEAVERLTALGWRVVIVWECELRRPQQLEERLRRIFLTPDGASDRRPMV